VPRRAGEPWAIIIDFPFDVGALSSLNTGFDDFRKSGGQDFDGKSLRHLSMKVRPLVGPLDSVKPIERPLLALTLSK
jgi:hypothetical protein